VTEHEKVLQLIGAKSRQPIQLDPAAVALIVVDAQINFTRGDAPFAQALERVVPGVTSGYIARVSSLALPNVARLQKAFRAAGAPILYTATGTSTGCGRDLAGWLQGFDALGNAVMGKPVWPKAGEAAWQIDTAVAPLPGELVVNKTSSDALNATALDQTLRNLRITTVVVCGFSTDVCVSSTARAAADRGFQVVVAEDACATLSPEMHRGALEALALAFARVCDTDTIVELVAARQAAAAK
jgi:nicotinamidase-related amidase